MEVAYSKLVKLNRVKSKRRIRASAARRARPARRRRTIEVSHNGSRRRARARLRIASRPARRHASNGSKASAKSSPQSIQQRRIEAHYQSALKNFEAAVSAFQKHNFERARELFAKVAAGPTGEVAVRAETYLRMCEGKLHPAQPVAKTAAELYDLGIAQLNARQLEAALESLKRAFALSPHQEHIRYALAAAHAQQGNVETALEHLKAAIELRPANRYLASRDEDFQPLTADPRFARLLQSGGA